MTDQHSTPTIEIEDGEAAADVVSEATEVIDVALARMMKRELISAGEVADLLLDLRTLLNSH